ncbi:MAG: hypothetical protein HY716_03555 [Planctomycetes bacterium]|nr:hypothetical protein [Planctomycetota bacterium]
MHLKRDVTKRRDPIDCVFDGTLTPEEELAVVDRVGADLEAARKLYRTARFEAHLIHVAPDVEHQAVPHEECRSDMDGSWERVSSVSPLLLALAGAAAILLLIIGEPAPEAPRAAGERRDGDAAFTSRRVGPPDGARENGAGKGASFSVAVPDPGTYEAWRNARRERSAKTAEVPNLLGAAHRALDRGDYDAAVETHQKAQALQAEVAALDKALEGLIPELVRELVKEAAEDPPTRDRAIVRLALDVGAAATAELEALVRTDDAPARGHARRFLQLLNIIGAEPAGDAFFGSCNSNSAIHSDGIENTNQGQALVRVFNSIGEDGLYRQWANHARASSEYSAEGWSARQACGAPNTPTAGDQPTAWASLDPNGGLQWIELSYELPVQPVGVRIHQTHNPGAVVRIEAGGAQKQWTLLWQGADRAAECPRWLDVRFDPPPFSTRAIKITLDTKLVPGWNEIDAVELIGRPAKSLKK